VPVATKLLGAAAASGGALLVLASVHAELIDLAAGIVLSAALLVVAHAAFRLTDPTERNR
jgi:hypothetical protein